VPAIAAQRPKPVVLLILDGWGHREDPRDNALALANLPHWRRLWAERPHTLVHTEGRHVGLPDGQMGNSEVGHMNLGAGRIVYQDFTRITKAIRDGDFFANPALTGAVDKATRIGGAVHIMGLLSPGGVHSHEDHLHAMVDLAVQRGAKAVYVHAFLDGRDTPPRSAEPSLAAMRDHLHKTGKGRVASVVGRYFAMDRDNRWDRVEQAYRLLTEGEAPYRAADPVQALKDAYARDENDEFVKATVIAAPGEQPAFIRDGDAVVFMNFRADRARQLTAAFVDPAFDGFAARRPRLSRFVCLSQYDARLPATLAFAPDDLRHTFGEVLADAGLAQLRIAETEKYAHVTFFFSGGREDPFPGETRVLIPSPQVATYDLQPEMSCPELTDRLVAAIEGGAFDAIVCNIANPDMVGHTGDLQAAIRAAEAVDTAIGRIAGAVQRVGGALLITADHGNLELMRDPDTGQPHTAHTVGPVPLVYLGERAAGPRDGGALRDIAPTLLDLLGLPPPPQMSGRSLLLPG